MKIQLIVFLSICGISVFASEYTSMFPCYVSTSTTPTASSGHNSLSVSLPNMPRLKKLFESSLVDVTESPIASSVENNASIANNGPIICDAIRFNKRPLACCIYSDFERFFVLAMHTDNNVYMLNKTYPERSRNLGKMRAVALGKKGRIFFGCDKEAGAEIGCLSVKNKKAKRGGGDSIEVDEVVFENMIKGNVTAYQLVVNKQENALAVYYADGEASVCGIKIKVFANEQEKNINLNFLKVGSVKHMKWHPLETSQLYIKTDKSIYVYDYLTNQNLVLINDLGPSAEFDFTEDGEAIYTANEQNNLIFVDLKKATALDTDIKLRDCSIMRNIYKNFFLCMPQETEGKLAIAHISSFKPCTMQAQLLENGEDDFDVQKFARLLMIDKMEKTIWMPSFSEARGAYFDIISYAYLCTSE